MKRERYPFDRSLKPFFDISHHGPSPEPLLRNRHGGPLDRGRADAWYERPAAPHYYLGATYQSPRLGESDMTPEQINDYREGYETGGTDR